VLFLFLVGLELDPRLLQTNLRSSFVVAVAGMALPFGAGTAVSYGLYKLQNTPNVSFPNFLVFVGVAVSITAFPVLARILAELKLLKTDVGAITMSAGLLNDCTAWILLALVVALINASSGLVALYTFLMAIAWTLILVFVVGPLFKKLCVSNGSLESGPTPLTMSILLILVLLSAFVTDTIGIHPVFGGFLVGIIVPHEHSFAIYVTEKIEDMVSIVFLPLYFALSGLKTQIGLLNSGPVWGYVFLVIAVACFGKVTGCTLAAKASGMSWRNSFTVGFLMNCKGLVELIVLNIGHDAGVINDQIFVIMIVMALVTTLMTTPIVMFLYPPAYHRRNELAGKRPASSDIEGAAMTPTDLGQTEAFHLVVCLNRLQHVPSLMTFIQMLNPSTSRKRRDPKLEVHALRLVELTQRTSAVMMMAQTEETIRQDPVINVFRTFGLLNSIGIESSVSIAPIGDFARNVREKATDTMANMVLLPLDSHSTTTDNLNLFEHLLASDAADAEWSAQNAHFVLGVLRYANNFSVGLFLDRGFGLMHSTDSESDDSASNKDKDIADEYFNPSPNNAIANLPGRSQRIFVAFLGGPDDREAVSFAFKLARHSSVSLSVFWYKLPADHEVKIPDSLQVTPATTLVADGKGQFINSGLNSPGLNTPYEGIYSHETTIGQNQSLVQSDLEDELHLNNLFNTGEESTRPRAHLETVVTSQPLHAACERAQKSLTTKDLVIVGRKLTKKGPLYSELLSMFAESAAADEAHSHSHSHSHSHRHPKGLSSNSEMRKVFGDVAYGMITTGVKASLLVVQSQRPQQSQH